MGGSKFKKFQNLTSPPSNGSFFEYSKSLKT